MKGRHERTDWGADRQVGRQVGGVESWAVGCMDRWMNGQMDRWADRQTGGRIER